jgi:centromeric protein E
VSDADRRAEGKHINRSLLALREVVHKLTEKGKRGHIPYRDSKLTHLLENVLGGDSNICVICTMSAQEEHQTETLETLKFAGRCSQVVTKAQKNILQSSEQALIRAKDMEISELRRQLEEVGASAAAEARAQEGHAELVGELEKMEKRKAQLRNELAHLNSQILTSENPAAGSGIGVGAAPSTPRKRRARISDVSAHSSAAHFLGLGGLAGTPRKTDRRAVSSVQRSMMVEEDSDMDSDGPTATERDLGQLASASVSGGYAVAMTLRATVTEREGQIAEQAELLAAVKAEAAELPVLKAELHGTKSALSSARDEHAAQLRDLEAELESTRVAHAQSVADERASIEGLEAQVLALREEREEARTATGEHGKRVQGLEARVAAAESERDARAAELAALREAHAAALAALEKERDAAQAAQAVVSAKRADVEAKLVASGEERAVEAASLKAEKEKATAALETFQRAALEREADVVATLRADLVKERTRREAGVAEIEAMVKRATEEGDAHAKEKGELAAQLAAIRAEHEAATANFQTASAARDAAEAAAKSASEAATKRETGLTSELAAAVEERDALRTQHATAAAAAEQVSAQLAEREAAHAAAVKDVEALRAGADVAASVRAELDTHRGLLAAERDKAAAAAATHAETCARADALADKLGAAERAAKAHAEEKDASASEARTSAARVAELVAALEDAHKGHAAAATRAAADLRSADDARRDEARAIRSELEGVKARLVSVTCTLEEERAARTATAAGAEDVAKAMAELRAELAAAKNETAQRAEREAALVAKNEALEKAAKVAADAEAARIKAEAEIKTKAKGHAVSASVPNALPGPPASACPAHVAEIERLDKVVNAQKAIIEEQRAKIAHWAGELERQREVVRLLSEGVSPHSGPIPLPSVSAVSTPSSPRKSASVVSGTSAASDTLTPTASPRANGSKHARYLGGSTPSSYLAPPSPLPMPTHSGQQSNVLRKARRITIEHDMGRLADAGRVNQVKGVFDSPDKSKLNDKEKEVKRAPVVPGAAPAAARDVFRRA